MEFLVGLIIFSIVYLIYNNLITDLNSKKEDKQKDDFRMPIITAEEVMIKASKEKREKLVVPARLNIERPIIGQSINQKPIPKTEIPPQPKITVPPIQEPKKMGNHEEKENPLIKLMKTMESNPEVRSLMGEALNQVQNDTGTKECLCCKRVQPISEFRANSNQPDGLTKWCIKCLNNGGTQRETQSGLKYCPKCKSNHRKSSYYPTDKYEDGLSKWCKFCLEKHSRGKK